MAKKDGSMTMTGRRCAAPLGEVSGDDLSLIYYYTILPNLFLSLHPDYVLIHRGQPIAVDHTRIYCDWFFHKDVANDIVLVRTDVPMYKTFLAMIRTNLANTIKTLCLRYKKVGILAVP